MPSISKTILAAAAIATATLAVGGCPGSVPGVPDRPNIPGHASSVDPNTCGNYAASDAGRKLKAFFEATVKLDEAVKNTENYVKDSCIIMGKELGMASVDGNTKEVCSKVIAELKNHLKLGIKAESKLDVKYTPAVCEINVDAAANVAAKCEAKASADVQVTCSGACSGTCSGSCSGTCNGKCSGTCKGSTGAGGECNGVCEGTCEGSCSAGCSGSCSGGCEGNADVQASAECKAQAEVYASVEAKCTEPELDIAWNNEMALDTAKAEAAIKAIKAGIPRILMVQAKLTGPIKAAFTVWAKTARDLAKSGDKLARSFDDQALCIAGQISAAAAMLASIEVSIDVQVEVSAEASGSIGG